ncbi:hypothetical protein [Chitinimonas lacunae]|uniref:Phosphate ABC transporter substrate-binding protein n=1 Tax=Chitinimonas lacunae TaxID=1963018 RepID=A0ABV8MKF2_9NEIS
MPTDTALRSTPQIRRRLCLLLAVAALQSTCAADWVVVASSQSPLSKLSREQVANLYLGQIHELPGSGRIVPVDLAEESPLRQQFYSQVANKTPVQVRMHWSKMIFNGKGRPPQEVQNSNDMKRLLNANPSSIGYMDRLVVDGTLKVLLIP